MNVEGINSILVNSQERFSSSDLSQFFDSLQQDYLLFEYERAVEKIDQFLKTGETPNP